MESVVRTLYAAQYAGGGASAEVLTAVGELTQLTGNTWSVERVTDAGLILRETGPSGLTDLWAVANGDVVVVDPSVGIVDRLQPAAFFARYGRVTDLATTVAGALLASPEFVAAVAAAVRAASAGNVRPSG
jgi:hypothetical protein